MPRETHNIVRPPFVVDPHSIDRYSGRQIAWNLVPDSFRPGSVVVTVGANAAQGATSVTVGALSGPIPSGAFLYFGGAKVATLTAAAATGAVALTVAALPTALVTNDVATYATANAKRLPAGTIVGRVLGAGKVSPRVVTTNPAWGILETSAVEGEPYAAKSGYGVIAGGVFYENLLPDATGGPPKTLAGAIKTELGTAFTFETYGDSRS